MGWFSGKRKHIQSLSFVGLREQMEMYHYVQKQIKFAVIPTDDIAENYNVEIWKFKNDYRKSFNDNFLEQMNALPYDVDFKIKDFGTLNTYMQGEIADYIDFVIIEDTNRDILGVNPNNNPTIMEVYRQILIDINYSYRYYHYDSNEHYYYFSDNPNVTEDVDDIRYKDINNISLYNDDKNIDFHYDIIKLEDDNGNIVHTTISSNNIHTVDSQEYYLCKVYYIAEDDPNNTTRFIYAPYSYYNANSSTSDGDTYSFAPMIDLKDEASMNQTEKNNQRRLLDMFGVDLDSIKAYLENGKITNFRVSLALPPESVTRSEACMVYLADFLEQVGGEQGVNPNLQFSGSSYNREFDIEYDGLTYTFKFSLYEDIISGLTITNFHEWKVVLKQVISSSDFYYDDVKTIYETVMGISDSKTTREMYNEIVQAYRANPNDIALKDAYNDLPPDNCRDTHLARKIVYANCEEADIENILHDIMWDLDDDGNEVQQLYEVDSYHIHRSVDPSIIQNYYCEMIDGNRSFYITNDAGEQEVITAKNVVVTVYKKVGSNWKKMIFTDGTVEYTIDGHTARLVYNKADGSFRIPMLHDSLKQTTFKQYCGLYDNGLCGLIYVHQVQKIKWYQRGGWKIVFKIVMIVIAIVVTVASAGAGAGIGAILADMAINIAVGMAITYIALKLAEVIGGQFGVILAVIATVVAYYYSGTATDTSQLWLVASDIYLKANSQYLALELQKMQESYDKYKEEIDRKLKFYQMQIEDMQSRHKSTQTIAEYFLNQMMSEDLVPSDFTVEQLENIDEDSYQIADIEPLNYNLLDKSYNQLEIPIAVYDYEQNMYKIDEYGDITNN